MVKRIFLFSLVNILVLVTISLVASFFGIGAYDSGMRGGQIDLQALLVFCLLWGMAGAFISLALSRVMAKWMMGVKVIPVDAREPELQWLVRTVHQLAKRAGIEKMPQVGFYDSPEVNAFATGPTKNRALVAVSAGLLQRMSQEEVEGVLGHEISHVANGDMVTMTLIQGVINAFVMFFARIIAHVVSQSVKDEMRYIVYFVSLIVFEIAFAFLGMFVVAYFSRLREFRADAGGAKLAGRDKMINALKKLRGTTELIDNRQQSLATLKISSRGSGLMALISTHPSLDVRIARLERGR